MTKYPPGISKTLCCYKKFFYKKKHYFFIKYYACILVYVEVIFILQFHIFFFYCKDKPTLKCKNRI